ncbi:hypothetical protein CDV36_005455, partial [Fusarium kuroshium]
MGKKEWIKRCTSVFLALAFVCILALGIEALSNEQSVKSGIATLQAGLKRALDITTHRVPIHVCLDNTSVIGGLRGRPGESSQHAFLEFRDLAKAHGA